MQDASAALSRQILSPLNYVCFLDAVDIRA